MSDELSVTGQGPDDDGLAARVGSDRTAFAALYDRFYPRVLKYCVRRLFNRETAEDVTSEVFLNVAAHVREFAGQTETDFRRWLFRIAANAVNAQLRKTLRRRELWEHDARHAILDRDGVHRSNPDDQAGLDWPEVHQALLQLDERDQAIISLRFFAELSHEEIAEVVQATPGAVRTALSRVLQRLREKFAPDNRPIRVPG